MRPATDLFAGWADRCAALLLAPFVLAALAILCPILLIVQGRPIFFVSERMKTCDEAFRLIKLRTMHVDPSAPVSVLGGHARSRVTTLGRVLRKTRMDELPQLFNVLRGDMRFIGPRPALRRYVEAYPDIYSRVLTRPPGITGLATVLFHAREAALLRRCRSGVEADAVFRRVCIPAKARIDLFYHRNRTLALDLRILYWTFSRLLAGPAPRRRRVVVLERRVSSPAWPARGSLKAAS